MTDLVLVNPGGSESIYQGLASEFTAIEPPLWCRLIAGYIRNRGYSVDIIDAAASGDTAEDVARIVVEFCKPRIAVVVPYGHQPSSSTQAMPAAAEICKALSLWKHSPFTMLVGGHVSALAVRTMRENFVNATCNSEGPITIADYLAGVTTPRGLVTTLGQHVMEYPAPLLLTELDRDLHGDVWDLLPMDLYRAHNWHAFTGPRKPYASIYTSLGCPYKCVFCCINAPFGMNRYRMRSPRAVVDEIDRLCNVYGVQTLKITDEMFVLNERHYTAICDGLIERGLGKELNIWAYARIDTIKAHTLEKMRKAGIRWLALGIESGSEHVRDGAAKSFMQEDIVEAVRWIQMNGINVIGNFIFGLPDDTHKTMRQTLDLAKELRCEYANFYSAMAYPGSPLYRTAVEKGWRLPENWSGYSQHSYDCTPLETETLSSEDVLAFRDAAFQEYFTDPSYLAMIAAKFGAEKRAEIERMTQYKLKRKILENYVPREKVSTDIC